MLYRLTSLNHCTTGQHDLTHDFQTDRQTDPQTHSIAPCKTSPAHGVVPMVR